MDRRGIELHELDADGDGVKCQLFRTSNGWKAVPDVEWMKNQAQAIGPPLPEIGPPEDSHAASSPAFWHRSNCMLLAVILIHTY